MRQQQMINKFTYPNHNLIMQFTSYIQLQPSSNLSQNWPNQAKYSDHVISTGNRFFEVARGKFLRICYGFVLIAFWELTVHLFLTAIDDIFCRYWNGLYFKNRIENMSKTAFSFDQDTKSTTLNKVQNKSRLLKIQQKLQAITLQRQTQVKESLQEQLTKRITDLEVNSAEEIKLIEAKFRVLKEELGQAKLKESQFIKKLQLSRKTRAVQIAEIHKKIASLTSFQTKDRKDVESALSRSIEIKTDSLLKDLKQTKQARIERINELQERLEIEMPETHMEIKEGCAQVQDQLEQLHAKAKEEAMVFREQVQRQQADRQKTVKSIMQMINSTVEEIKADLQQERVARNKNKQQLLVLFNSAYTKLNAQ